MPWKGLVTQVGHVTAPRLEETQVRANKIYVVLAISSVTNIVRARSMNLRIQEERPSSDFRSHSSRQKVFYSDCFSFLEEVTSKILRMRLFFAVYFL